MIIDIIILFGENDNLHFSACIYKKKYNLYAPMNLEIKNIESIQQSWIKVMRTYFPRLYLFLINILYPSLYYCSRIYSWNGIDIRKHLYYITCRHNIYRTFTWFRFHKTATPGRNKSQLFDILVFMVRILYRL